ncbi:MAG: formate dehydrogenase accessory sulfurtransferase FdhD [Gracilibacteraceae bacterium]|jgi:FdhD protein|nr:formate dehydrogenase accessory sulfurtransferase FdhD [Gracilibacteraceae bacterium]
MRPNHNNQSGEANPPPASEIAAVAPAGAVVKINGRHVAAAEETVATELPLTVYLNRKELVTLVCSPGGEEDLITGFLVSEGIVAAPADISSLRLNRRRGLAAIETKSTDPLSEDMFLKRGISSCCGKGRTSFYFVNDARMAKSRQIARDWQVKVQDIYHYMELLEAASAIFRQTGGVHEGALAADGKLSCFAFDIGRHNVLDKLYGQALRQGDDVARHAVVFSGRISSEILIKTGKMGCPLIAGASAPTDLALELARELGITVIGFARRERMNIYTHPERVAAD